ncbi:MAG: GNAT family N-acetyltransferase [Candidatus Abyssobacteria bacterium SURF_17]|uniref:GNAT family N-acetyltransferase n=1 Tax=Candidatus Abyssobacteria bacterium SURF_17 TaxID=2093361 RepID=A0A419EYL1_9BACT|nr:MAG: GNAT family N-acetyltransferase [Candidatus Abyssubacteria bacterium SURF_17]
MAKEGRKSNANEFAPTDGCPQSSIVGEIHGSQVCAQATAKLEPAGISDNFSSRRMSSSLSGSEKMEIVNLKERVEFIPILAVWHHNQWSYLNPDGSIEQRVASLETELKSDGIPKTFVAVSGEALLGSASLVPHDMDTRMDLSPWLASVFVAPDARKQGIGSALIRHVVKEAGRLGYRTIYLFTEPDKVGFYARLGWSHLETTVYRGHNECIMVIRAM